MTCLQSLIDARKAGKDCFEHGERFADTNDWQIAGIVCAIHCVLPIVWSLVLWEVLKFGKDCASRGLRSLSRLPVPIIAKFNKFISLRRMYNNFARKDRFENMKEYEENKKIYQKQLDKIEDIVNLSLILEASLEASFQFFFQTVYIMPSVVVAFNALFDSKTFAWEDLFNRRITSILLSFLTFSWAFYAIR